MKPEARAQKRPAGKRKPPSAEEIQTAIELLEKRNQDEMLTTEEAEEITGFTQQSFYNWIKRSVNALPASKPGREWRIRVGDLVAFLRLREFRADDGDEGAGARGGRRRASNLRLLRPVPAPSVEGEGQATITAPARDEEVTSSTRAVEMIESLLGLAEAGLKWRRACLTMQTADASEEADWIAECEAETMRRQAELFSACSPIGAKGLQSLRLALDAARDELRGREAQPHEGNEPTEGVDLDAETFDRLSEIFSTTFTRFTK